MSISRDEREENRRQALKALVEDLRDRDITFALFEAAQYPFILSTTWQDLVDERSIEQTERVIGGPSRYRFTPDGYYQGLEISGVTKSQEFLELLGKVCKALKESVKGRNVERVMDWANAVELSGVPRDALFNIIQCRLIERVLGRIGADRIRLQLIKIPVNFGMKLR